MSPVASFHLVTERRGRQPLAIARLGLDRPVLERVAGLSFVRTLGTARGASTGPSIQPLRTAAFIVWRDVDDLDRFLADHPIARRWERAHEAWHVRLRSIRAHGRWGAMTADDLPMATDDADAKTTGADGPVVVLTRAVIRLGATRDFVRASRSLGHATALARGNRAVVGIGERPIGRLGTVSVWDSADDARRFASEHTVHRAAMNAARADGWFREELFATFAPVDSSGTWNGLDPVTRERG